MQLSAIISWGSRALAIGVVAAVPAWPLACSSAQAGNWSAVATWTSCGGGVPGIGDTVTIGHAVAVTDNRTVGHSPAAGDATAAVLVNTPGTLSVATGVTFVVRGDLKLNNTTLTLAGGSIYEFDASAAVVPATALYVLQIGTAINQASARFITTGTLGSRVTVRSNAGGANGRFTHASTGTGQATIAYTDFLRIGDASNDAIRFHPSSATYTWSLTDSIFDACGGTVWNSGSPNGAAQITIERNTWKNTVQTNPLTFTLNNAVYTSGGFFKLKNNVFDKRPTGVWSQVQVEGNFFRLGTAGTGSTHANGPWALFKNNIVYWENGAAPITQVGDMLDNYFLMALDGVNPKYVQTSVERNVVNDGAIFEHLGTDTTGDGFIIQGGSSTVRTGTIRNALQLTNQTGGAAGTFWCLAADAYSSVAAEKNTLIPGGPGDASGPRCCETYQGRAGYVLFHRSNAYLGNGSSYKIYAASTVVSVDTTANTISLGFGSGWSEGQKIWFRTASSLPSATPALSAGTIYYIHNPSGANFQVCTTPACTTLGVDILDFTSTGTASQGYLADIVPTGTDADYNGGLPSQFLAGQSGNGYDIKLSDGTTPGTHDVNEDPQFVDPTRKLATWRAYLCQCSESFSTAVTNALAELAKRNDASGYDPRYNIPGLINWIRQGYAPRNLKYATGGHDGGRIGAVQPVPMFGGF